MRKNLRTVLAIASLSATASYAIPLKAQDDNNIAGKTGNVLRASYHPCKFFVVINTETDKLSVVKYIDDYDPKDNQTIVGNFEAYGLQTVFNVNAKKFSQIMIIAGPTKMENASDLLTRLCFETK